MKQEGVQDFLNLPGIIGIALISAQSRPYFCGVDRLLNFQQREALAQGIQQVLDTTPDSFECFEFQFNEHRVHLYKLDHGAILLVLALNSFGKTAHLEIFNCLKLEIQKNIPVAIAIFRQFAEVSPFGKLARQTELSPAELSSNLAFERSFELALAPLPPFHLSPEPPPVLLSDLLVALNQLSHFGAQYLGATVVTNNWKTARPDSQWLSQFQIDRKGQISFVGQMTEKTLASLDQQQQVQRWVAAFVDRCSQVLRTFPKTVRQKALDQRQQALLMPEL